MRRAVPAEPPTAAPSTAEGAAGTYPATTTHFWLWTSGFAVLAFALRLTFALSVPDRLIVGDALYYHELGNLLADGKGFINPYLWIAQQREVISAFHPPLFSLLLAGGSLVGGPSVVSHEVVASLIGSGTCIAVALLGREIGGPRVGVIASGIAAVYPQRLVVDALIYSEGLAAALTALTLLLVYRLQRRRTLPVAAACGVSLGLAALTRFEVLLLAPLLIIPGILLLRDESWCRRAKLLVITGLAAVVVVAPWAIYNTMRFDRPVVASTNGDAVIFFSNCRSTYYDAAYVGSWDTTCGLEGGRTAIRCDWFDDGSHPECGDEAERSASLRDRGLRYLRNHPARFVAVVAPARIARAWDVYRPFDNASASIRVLNRHRTLTNLGVWVYWLVFVAAILGVLTIRQRGTVRLWPLISPAIAVTVVAVYAYGTMRFRATIEPSLFVLSAVALDERMRRVRAGRRSTPRRSHGASHPSG
jgi:4-amino-4-deoxy-L-arabinose transferase-like glycosyltransferase